MMHERGTMPNPERRGSGLAVTFAGALVLAAAIVLLTGALGWRMSGTTRHEIKTAQPSADGGGATAVSDGFLARPDRAGPVLAAGVAIGVVLLAGMYLYLVKIVVRPLRANARLLRRLAAGDCGVDVPDRQLTRSDEIGDVARAIRDLAAYQRREAGIVDDMSAGDFTDAVAVRDPTDALGLAVRKMAGVTIDTLKYVNAHAGRAKAGCEAIASAGRELSANEADITAAATKISAGVARVGAHADGNAGVAEQASRLANTGSQSVERGYEDIGEMGVVMLNMQACGDKIVKIAKSIGDIAFQTNLLALNASVEAARAGRHGKGFTIVAGEVRSLAVRSRRAAEETSTLMQETVEQVELAAAIAGRINATFSEMQTNIQEVDVLLAKIVAASREQSGDINQISTALHRMDRSAEENAGHVGDILGQIERLTRQTEQLRQAMGRFGRDLGRSSHSEPFAGSGAPSPSIDVLPQPAALAWGRDAQRP